MAQINISHPFPFANPKDHEEIRAYILAKGYTYKSMNSEGESGEITIFIQESLTAPEIATLVSAINSDGNNCRITN